MTWRLFLSPVGVPVRGIALLRLTKDKIPAPTGLGRRYPTAYSGQSYPDTCTPFPELVTASFKLH